MEKSERIVAGKIKLTTIEITEVELVAERKQIKCDPMDMEHLPKLGCEECEDD